MGQHRQHNKHLPPHLYLRKGRYYWIGAREGKRPCTPLGDDYVRALIKWREIEDAPAAIFTIAAMLDRYTAVADVAEVTRAGYIAQTNHLKPVFQGFSLEDVKPRHIKQYLNARPPSSGVHEMAIFSAAWNSALDAGLTEITNPCAGIRRKHVKRHLRASTAAEEKRLIVGPSQIAVVVELALLTGLRQTDLRLLRLSDITADALIVTPSKTAKRTHATLRFQMTPALRACLSRAQLLRRRVSSIYLFPSRTGQPYTMDGFQSVWKKHCAKCNVTGLEFRGLRRSAIRAIEDQSGLDTARKFAAHASVTTTEIYTKRIGATRVKPTR